MKHQFQQHEAPTLDRLIDTWLELEPTKVVILERNGIEELVCENVVIGELDQMKVAFTPEDSLSMQGALQRLVKEKLVYLSLNGYEVSFMMCYARSKAVQNAYAWAAEIQVRHAPMKIKTLTPERPQIIHVASNDIAQSLLLAYIMFLRQVWIPKRKKEAQS